MGHEQESLPKALHVQDPTVLFCDDPNKEHYSKPGICLDERGWQNADSNILQAGLAQGN